MPDHQNVPRPTPDVSEGGILLPPLDRQFLEPGADGGQGDVDADAFEDFEAGFEDTLSAEEAAMRVVDEPPGMNDDPDPGYVDHQLLGPDQEVAR